MKHIVLFGAGKSATCLIDYLKKQVPLNGWQLSVCDSNLALAQSKTGDSENVRAVCVQVSDTSERNALVKSADIVISLLPPELHFMVALDCVAFNKNLLTASYIDKDIRSLQADIQSKGLLFLCEMGLDPGIDHMSVMKLVQAITSRQGKLTSCMSHCGGLVAPESDDNPWHYKITWNPRNVVLAAKEGAVYKKENKTINVPYPEIFKSNSVDIPGLHTLSWYPNRDSLPYISLYRLDHTSTFIRTTLRYPSFIRGWNKLVSTGCTSTTDFEQIKDCKTFKDWFNAKIHPFLSGNANWNNYLQMHVIDPYKEEFRLQLNALRFYSEDALPSGFSCSADILQYAMEQNLAMKDDDRDMIVMLHELAYETIENGQTRKDKIKSCMVVKGDDKVKTAMAKTVGLPLGIAAKLILQQKIKLTGLHIPIVPEIYEPVLKELEENGIIFNETKESISE